MARTASPYDISVVIAEELQKYSEEVTDKVKQIVDDVSTELVENLKQDSPKRPGSGAYAKSWTSKVEYEDNLIKRVRVYNSKHYQLTHLLEYGHAKRGGGRVAGIPHIKPNEEKAIEELERRIEEAIKNDTG